MECYRNLYNKLKLVKGREIKDPRDKGTHTHPHIEKIAKQSQHMKSQGQQKRNEKKKNRKEI